MERKPGEGYSEQKKWLVHPEQNKNRSEVKPITSRSWKTRKVWEERGTIEEKRAFKKTLRNSTRS